MYNIIDFESDEEIHLKVKIRFFALYRDLVGSSEVECEIEPGDTVNTLIMKLKDRYHELPCTPAMIAVNAEYVESDFMLNDGDDIAVLPPFSGG